MEKIFIGLGANLDEPEFQLAEARWRVHLHIGPIISDSKVYRTQAWGKTDQPDFFNQVVEVSSRLPPDALLRQLLRIEQDMGRVRQAKWEARRIDLDLLFYDQQVIRDSGLTVPHPELHRRNFVLVPMAEIAPDFIHPVFGRTMAELLQASPDELATRPV